jgi:histidinol dehydrogenase
MSIQENAMLPIYNAGSDAADAALRDIEARSSAASAQAFQVADEMIAGVRAGGDTYVAAQIEKFDRVTLDPSQIAITPGNETIAPELAQAIETAIARVEAFHQQQLPAGYTWRDGAATVTHRVAPLRRVGIYAPGGRAVYVSTLIMCAVPARIAGVRELVVATTPAAAARPELRYTCARLGIETIYRSGGAAGIAAMALGTTTLPRVDKIVGPGNAYVTAAKARLIGSVGIDMTAGPTELVVIADDTADAALVAADLAAQAEHGADSAVICITTSRRFAEEVASACGVWSVLRERAVSGSSPQVILIAASIDEALEIADRIAPEHLAIQAANASSIAERAQNCGAIYCGPFSPPAAGDYVVGSNHVLPTSGSARFFSPLGVYDFVKRTNVIALDAATLATIAPSGIALADFEGLPDHGRSIAARATAPAVVEEA